MLCVVGNTGILSSDGLNTDPVLVTKFSLAFTYIFIGELILKNIGYGTIGYCRDKMNLFDAVIVGLSLMELALANGWEGN